MNGSICLEMCMLTLTCTAPTSKDVSQNIHLYSCTCETQNDAHRWQVQASDTPKINTAIYCCKVNCWNGCSRSEFVWWIKVSRFLERNCREKISASLLQFSCTPSVRKNKQNYFFYNYVKLLPNLTVFGTKMTNSLKLYEVHSFSTSPNSRQCTTVLNADVNRSEFVWW